MNQLFEQCDGNHYFETDSLVLFLFLLIYLFIYFILFIFIYKSLTFNFCLPGPMERVPFVTYFNMLTNLSLSLSLSLSLLVWRGIS